ERNILMAKDATRANILQSAASIVQSDGILDFTLEAVAKHAGISKGGLLYHFPSKDALVSGMVHHLMQNYLDNTKENAEQDTTQKGKWTRSFIKETFQQSTPEHNTDAALMAAAAINPELLKPVQDAYEHWQQQI